MERQKPTMTKQQLTQRVNEEAKVMRDQIKKEGGNLTFAECKKEARKVFTEEYNIV
jgi:Fe-S cluster biogenesis protein NfuA